MSEAPQHGNKRRSSLSVGEHIEHVGTAFHRADTTDQYRALPLFRDEHGECFFKLTNKDDPSYAKRRPHIQAMVTMLIKGVIPSAEVIPVKKRTILNNPTATDMRPDYYSHLIPYTIDTSVQHVVPADAHADIFLLEMLFNDTEHAIHPQFPHNILVHGSHYALFDFSEAAFRVNHISRAHVERLKKRNGYTDAVLSKVRERLNELEAQLSSPAGLQEYAQMKQKLKDAGELDEILEEIPENGPEILLANIRALQSVLV